MVPRKVTGAITPDPLIAPNASTGADARRVGHHRLYVPSRVIASGLSLVLFALMWRSGEPLPPGSPLIIAAIVLWPPVMYAFRFPFPSNRAADLLQIFDGIAVGLLLGLARSQAFFLIFFGYIFSAVAIGGLRGLALSSAIASASCGAALAFAHAHLEMSRTLSAADVLAITVFALYALFIASVGYDSRRRLLATRRALGILRRDLELRVEERTRTLASTNAAIARFVPQEFLRALGHEDVTTARLGDATVRDITVLFADIRNFTTISERMSPEDTLRFLNDCLSRIGPHIRAQSGFVDKYIGDAIMALFPASPADAVRAAIAMQREIGMQKVAGDPSNALAIGIGIHTGRVMMGTIGEAQRFEATVISDAVNVTARLESLTKHLGCSVLITAQVAAHLSPDELQDTRVLGSFVVKGKSRAVGLVEVFATDPESLRRAKAASRERFVRARALYTQDDLAGALTILAEVARATPGDGPVAWWHARVARETALGASPGSNRHVVELDEK